METAVTVPGAGSNKLRLGKRVRNWHRRGLFDLAGLPLRSFVRMLAFRRTGPESLIARRWLAEVA